MKNIDSLINFIVFEWWNNWFASKLRDNAEFNDQAFLDIINVMKKINIFFKDSPDLPKKLFWSLDNIDMAFWKFLDSNLTKTKPEIRVYYSEFKKLHDSIIWMDKFGK